MATVIRGSASEPQWGNSPQTLSIFPQMVSGEWKVCRGAEYDPWPRVP